MQPARHQSTDRKAPVFTPVHLLLALGLLVGGLYCVFIPFGAGFDEETHLVRIFDISGFNFLPNNTAKGKTVTYMEFFRLSYQRRLFQTPANDLLEPPNLLKTPDRQNLTSALTRSIYPPVSFAPQALIAGISWRVFKLPIIPVSMLLRLAGLGVYLLGAYLTLRLLPTGKWVFLVLALSPMALYQAATLNADGFTSAASFLLMGMVLAFYTRSEEPLSGRAVWGLVAVSLLLGLAKPGAIVVLPLLLLLRRRVPSRGLALVLVLGVLAATAITVGWMVLTVPKSHFSAGESQSLTRQVGLALQNPGDFISGFFLGNLRALPAYLTDWIGVYGHWAGRVPEPVYGLYLLALLAALLAEKRFSGFSLPTRAFLLAMFLVSAGAILMLYYLVNYRPEFMALGRQGRYFVPMAPLFFIALAGWAALPERVTRAAQWVTVGALLLALGFYSLGLYAAYYTECGYGVLAGEPCVKPILKNIEKNNAPEVVVNASTPVSETFTHNCNRLEGVEILVKSVTPGAAGTLRFSVYNSSGQPLASQDYPLDTLPALSYLRLPVPVAPGLKYSDQDYRIDEIRLEAPEIASPAGVVVALLEGDDYPDGELTVAGEPRSSDLIFHYLCKNPWK